MKKKLFEIILFGLLIIGVTGCNNNSDKKVSLLIKEGTLSNIGITLILKNDSVRDYSYGEPYYIEKFQEGKWEKLETIHEMAFTLPAWNLESGKTVEISINWFYGYGQLESGKYRVVKEIFKGYIRSEITTVLPETELLNNPAIISLFPPIIVRSSFQFFISVSNTLQEGNSVETKVFIFNEL